MKKKIVMVLLTLLIATTVYTKWFNKQVLHQPVEQRVTIARTIDREAVIKSLDQKGEIVGMEGNVNKELEYKDSDFWGSINYKLNADIYFKMGYDLELVKRNMRIEGNTIYITSMPTKFIAFDVPYDQVEIDKKVKWFHKQLSAEDIQMLYGVLRQNAVVELFNDQQIKEKSKQMTQTTLRNFLMQIPEVKNVIFVEVGAHNG